MGISGNWEKRRVEPIAYWGEIDRRTFVKLSGASVAALIFGLGPYTEKVVAQPRFSDYPFSLGVASGDPLPDGVVLWTRPALPGPEGGRLPGLLRAPAAAPGLHAPGTGHAPLQAPRLR